MNYHYKTPMQNKIIEEVYKLYPHTIYCQQKIEELKVKFNMGAKCLCSPDIRINRNKVLDLIQSAKKEAVEECIKKIDDYGLDTVDRVIELLKNY